MDETLSIPDQEELLQNALDEVVKYIIEASVRIKCTTLTRIKAFLIYHHFKRCVHETRYDPKLVAPACLSLSVKDNEEDIDFDVIMLSFFNMFEGTCPSLQNKRYKEIKASVTSIEFLILRMIDFCLTFESAHEFLPYFMLVFREEVLHLNAWDLFAETCMRVASDFYFFHKCLNYKAEDIAATAIQVGLTFIGINLTGDCYLMAKLKALSGCEDSVRLDIVNDVFKICNLGPVAEKFKEALRANQRS